MGIEAAVMRCPMVFGDPCSDRDEECRADCTWLLEKTGKDGKTVRMCAVAMIGRRQMRGGRGRNGNCSSYAPYAVNVIKESG